MKKLLCVLMLSALAGTPTLAQQSPAIPPRTTPPAARTLTPAEQKQKDRIDREVQRDRQIRAEWAQKQREYEAKQAEKERQKQAKKAAKDAPPPAPKPTPAPPVRVDISAPVSPPSVPAVVEPSRQEKRDKRREKAAKAVEPAPPALVVVSETPAPAPVIQTPDIAPKVPKAPKAARAKRERPVRLKRTDSVAVLAGSSEPALSRPSREFLPNGHLFDPILLDPLEAQTYGSVLPVYNTEGNRYKGSIVPFAFGFAKPFYRRTTRPGHSEEWVLDLASFTQFEAYRDDKLNKARRQMINNDYKVSIIYNVRRGVNAYRFRVYHLSSHLADDYIYRNKITAPTPNSVNYELLDVTYSRYIQDWRLYAGAGLVLRRAEERKPLSAQFGTYYKKTSDRAARLVGGLDVKFWQQTNFRPGIHGGIGVEVGRTQNNLTFLLEGYSGFRPYSQFENEQTSWIGVGVYLNPF